MQPTFDDFERMVLFTHLEHRYRNRAWVIVDGDEAGREVVRKLQEKYGATWEVDRFRSLSATDIERYYPARFAEQVSTALAESDDNRRRNSKNALLREVLDWIQESPEEAKEAFASSAAEIVGVLREIEAVITGSQESSGAVSAPA